MFRTNRDRGTPGESPDRLIKLVHKFAKFLTENNNKVCEPLTYNEIINNLVHENK